MSQHERGFEASPGFGGREAPEQQRRRGPEAREPVQRPTRLGLLPYLSNQKRLFAAQLNDTANALRESGSQLPENGARDLLRMSAEKIDTMGSYLESHDLDELAGALRDYAHERPWQVMGGAFVVGLAAARFLKASGRPAARA